jgi:hypothetical protein
VSPPNLLIIGIITHLKNYANRLFLRVCGISGFVDTVDSVDELMVKKCK